MLLLHLSDIHFRRDAVKTRLDPDQQQRNEILRDVEQMCSTLGPVDAILLSGDIAYAGHPEEYEFAVQWLETLCHRCRTTLASVFVCPGNHDVDRGLAGRKMVQALHAVIKGPHDITGEAQLSSYLIEEETAHLLYEPLNAYNYFAGQFFCGLLPSEHTVATRDLELNDHSILRLVGLNSAVVSSAADQIGHLFVDTAYTQFPRTRGVEYLMMCHHPPRWLGNGRALEDFLRGVARVQLFGHEHDLRIDPNRDWVRVAAAATHPERHEMGWEPGYNLIELRVEGTGENRHLHVNVHVRVWQDDPVQFVPKMDRDGQPAFRSNFKLDSWEYHAVQDIPQVKAPSPAIAGDIAAAAGAGSDPMSTSLRELSIRFFKLSLSQKVAIAGQLGLIENEDVNQPDFERFRRVFIRARDRNLVDQLERAVEEAIGGSRP